MEINSPSWFVLSQQATTSLRPIAFVPAVIFTTLAFLIVVLRWYSKIRLIPGTWRFEDFVITAALLLSVGMTTVAGVDFARAAPIDNEQALLDSLSGKLKLVFAESLLYQLAVNLVKATLLTQYLRVFAQISYVRRSCYALLVLTLGAAGWGVFGLTFLCNPVKTYWDVRVEGRCMSAELHFWSTSIIGIVIDWAIWISPMPVVGGLRLPKRQKWGLWGVFGLGGFVCIVSILRLAVVHKAADEGKVTQSGTYAVVWSTIELNVAIVCASLVVMKPLFVKWIPAMASDQHVSANDERRVLRQLAAL